MIHDHKVNVRLQNKTSIENNLNLKFSIIDNEELKVNPLQEGTLTASFVPGDRFSLAFDRGPGLTLILGETNQISQDPITWNLSSEKNGTYIFKNSDLVLTITITPHPVLIPPTIGIVIVGTVDIGSH
jgi:hypothetical protein